MKINTYIFLIILLIIAGGCYTTDNFSTLKIEILNPAYVAPPPGNTVACALYNNSNYKKDSVNSGYVFNSKIFYDTRNTDSIASVLYYESFLNALRGDNYFDTVPDLGKRFPDVGADSLLILHKSEYDSIKKLYNCHTIYSLSHFEINDIAYYPDYAPFNIDIMIFIKAIWEVYGANKDTSSFLLVHKDTVTFTGPVSKLGEYDKYRYERPGLLKEAASDLGAKFSLFLLPHWEQVDRLFYYSSNPLFIKAWQYAKKNEWAKAADIWKQLSENRNKNIAAKSMYNLAIACEMESDFDAALEWAIKSFYVFEQKNSQHARHCMDYIKIITLRKQDKKILEKQITGAAIGSDSL